MAKERIEPPPVRPEQVNLHGLPLEYILETGADFANHRIFPDPGGRNQQSQRWLDVMNEVYLPGLNRAIFDAMPADQKAKYIPLDAIEETGRDVPLVPQKRLGDL